MDIGCRIKELRKREGLNQAELAKIINLTASAMSLIEAGKNNPTPDAIVKLCKFFKVSTDYLLTGNEEPTGISEEEREILEVIRTDNVVRNTVLDIAKFKKKAINFLVSYQPQQAHAA